MNNYCLTFLVFVNAVFGNNYWIWLLYDMKNYNNADQRRVLSTYSEDQGG